MKIKKIWDFVWYDDSFLAWFINLILAFLIVKFIIYPLLGFALATNLPVVAVISGSMQHYSAPVCIDFQDNKCVEYSKEDYRICDKQFNKKMYFSLDEYWNTCGDWYKENNISLQSFKSFPLKNGFNKGDIIFLTGHGNINLGDIVVFQGYSNKPIIHRVIKIKTENNKNYYTTKGDFNKDSSSDLGELNIPEEKIIGRAMFKVPFLGWIKILFSDLMNSVF